MVPAWRVAVVESDRDVSRTRDDLQVFAHLRARAADPSPAVDPDDERQSLAAFRPEDVEGRCPFGGVTPVGRPPAGTTRPGLPGWMSDVAVTSASDPDR
jgi:hypothetical protein